MRCLGWLAFISLLSSRAADCFVVRSPSPQNQRCGARAARCYRGVRHRRVPCPPLSWQTAAGRRTRGRQVKRVQVLQETSCSSSSSPELDAAAASVAATAAAAASSSGAQDTKTVQQETTLLSLMELALDVLGRSTQWVVASAVGIALVTRADVGTLVYVVGSLLNAVFSKILKKTINQVRPDGAQLTDPGMPSSHAMSLFYLGTYLVIGLQNHGVLVLDPSLPQWPLGVMETQLLLGAYAIIASLWRVKAGLHTLPQVLVGAAVGTVDAVLWHRFCHPYFLSQVETFFKGPDVPVELAVGVCLLTFLTFGNAQRKIAKLLTRKRQ